MATYQENKEKARQEAIKWQNEFAEKETTWEELREAQNHFRELAKRYGLVREFAENGIC